MIQGTVDGLSFVKKSKVASQDDLDESIMDYIISDLQPFSTTEKPAFRNLIMTLAPNRTIMCRKTVMARIDERYKCMRQKLINLLQKQRFVATTTDCWSAHHRSYIGVTVHWIDESSLKRVSAAVACRRLKGSHTYDVLAAVLEKIHSEFGIQDKTTKTTTDNGSNFCKAFDMYSQEFVGSTSSSAVTAHPSNDSTESDENSETEEAEEEDEQQFVCVADILANAKSTSDDEYNLPPHQRCACHTLNLIATHDVACADSDGAYKKLSRSTFAKCQSLWNKQSRSPKSAEVVQESFGLQFVVPNQTRWNSMFMSVERLNRLIGEKGMDVMNGVCDKLGVPQFRRAEVAFIAEYVTVMKPLATALDILQCETKVYMAYLVPTVMVLKEKMQFLLQNSSIQCCKPLVISLNAGIDKRFAQYTMNAELIASSIIHPKFKTAWIKDPEQKRLGLDFLINKIQQQQQLQLVTNSDGASTADEATSSEIEDDFFTFRSPCGTSVTPENILSAYISTSTNTSSLDNLHESTLLKSIFLELNTALPASAACERLFSVAGRVFMPNRTTMTDKHFEQQLLLRINSNL
jgi:hypothetical protein